MNVRAFAVFFCLSAACAQQAPPAVPDLAPDAVIATFDDGQKITFGELKRYIGFLPPQAQQAALKDRTAFVRQYALFRHLAKMAEEAKLDQESPTREELAMNRMQIMVNAQLNHALNDIIVPTTETEQYYAQHKDQYTEAKVRVIYLRFALHPQADGKKYRSEAETKALAEKLRAKITSGADFVKLAKEYSDDATSVAKDGDFGTIKRSDNIPQAIRESIFSLKEGQVSDPVRQPNGYYLFLADKLIQQPYNEVRDSIFTQLKQVRFNQWMSETSKALQVHLDNQAFFSGAPTANPAK